MMSKNVCVSVRELLRLPVWFVFEDGEEDAVHRGSVEEDAHGSDSPANLAEAAVDDVGGVHPLALGEGICRASRACPGASRGQQLVEIERPGKLAVVTILRASPAARDWQAVTFSVELFG